MLRLEYPQVRYKQSFLEMARDLAQRGHWYHEDPNYIEQHFDRYLERLKAVERGEGFINEQVGGTEYWMIFGDEVVGRLKLNFSLSEEMKVRGGHIGYGVRSGFEGRGFASEALRLALQIARTRQMFDILITCDENNHASRAVIEKNGGRLMDLIVAEGRSIRTCRYTFSLRPS